jgi:hypothetical protein
MTSPDGKNQRLQEFARQHFSGMDPTLRRDLGPLAKLYRMFHVGADRLGERITGEQRQTLRRNIDAQTRKLSGKYANGDVRQFNELMYRQHWHMTQVREELAKE